MKHLKLEHLLELHVLVIKETGGSDGLRDLGRLESAIAAQTQEVFGEVLYRTVFDKAAAICKGVIAGHPFIDGNKRTAMLACITLLEINGQKLVAKKGEIEDFAVLVAIEHLGIDEISKWLKAHSNSD